MRRALIISLLAGFSLAGFSAVASAQQYPPSGPTATLSSQSVGANRTITISGAGWLPGSTVTITLQSTPQTLGTAQVAADGTFSATVQIPCNVDPGQHTISVSGTGADGLPHTVSAALTVDPCGSPVSSLARTGGSNTIPYIGVGVGLILFGAMLTIAFTRRRKSTLGA